MAPVLPIGDRVRCAIASLPLLLASCGGGSIEGEDARPPEAPDGDAPAHVPCDADGDAIEPSGRWAFRARLHVDVDSAPGAELRVCPDPQVAEAGLIGLLDVTTALGGFVVTPTLCGLEAPAASTIVGDCADGATPFETRLLLPDALDAALPAARSAPGFAVVERAAERTRVAVSPFTVAVGVDDPRRPPPSWQLDAAGCGSDALGHGAACETTCVPSCGALRDDDGDGFPGVTVVMCGLVPDEGGASAGCGGPAAPILDGRVFGALAIEVGLEAEAQSACELVAAPSVHVRHGIVGLDASAAGSPIAVGTAVRNAPVYSVDASRSRLRATRVDGASGSPDWRLPADREASCAAVRARVHEL